MAMEPERHIEKLLRACAKRRGDQAGAPFELHPATRRLLQGEVARQLRPPRTPAPAWLQNLRRPWLQLGWGLALFAVLGFSAWLWVAGPGRARYETSLAKLEESQTELSRSAQADYAPAQHAPTQNRGDRRLAAAETEQLKKEKAASARLRQSTADETASTRRLGGQVTDRLSKEPSREQLFTQNLQGVPTPAEPPAAPPPSAGVVASTVPASPPAPADTESPLAKNEPGLGGDKYGYKALEQKQEPLSRFASGRMDSDTSSNLLLSNAAGQLLALGDAASASGKPGVVQQRFARVQPDAIVKDAPAASAAPSASVLRSFRLEQTGRELRIIDSDGSVYAGFLVSADAQSARPNPSAAKISGARTQRLESAASAPARSFAGQTYTFRVAGTNRSLHQPIVFSGSLTGLTNATPFVGQAPGGQAGASLQSSPVQFRPAPLLHSRISGQLRIGEAPPIPIQAAPAP